MTEGIGWVPLDVMQKTSRSWSWVALMVAVRPDTCNCSPQLWYADPESYRSMVARGSVVRSAAALSDRAAHQRWVDIPGKHRNQHAAWIALQDMLATRH